MKGDEKRKVRPISPAARCARIQTGPPTAPAGLFAPRLHVVRRCVSLFFQEQIKGPENGSIARFDGLGCYQTGSEISEGVRSAGGSESRAWPGLRQGLVAPDRAVWRLAVWPGWLSKRCARLERLSNAPKRCPVWGARGPSTARQASGLPRCALFSGANKRPRKRPHRTV